MSCGDSLFGPASQFIKTNSGDFVAVEGSNIRERLMLSDLRIPYKQILKSRVVLKKGQTNYLLNHLGLGDNATFLAIKAKYDSKSKIPDDNYVIYNYYDYPVKNFTLSELLVLTGNTTNRISQLYLSNPNVNYAVNIDVMVAVLDDTYSFFNDDINQNSTSFTGLEYTDIKSFVVGESIAIYDKNVPARALIYLGLTYINSITLNGTFLIIDDESYGTIFLNFLTEYDANQANSIINYVLENPNVDISTLNPVSDDISPVIYFNTIVNTGASPSAYIVNYTGATSGAPYNTSTGGFTYSTSIPLSSGTNSVIYKDRLRGFLIDHISDNRDGAMSMMDSEMIISGTSGVVDNINIMGTYSLSFNFEDIARNNLNGVNISLIIN